MAKQNDLVVKMTINSTDFDSGLKNAKASMNNFNKSTLSMSNVFKGAISGMMKAFSGLGVAMAAKNIFKDVNSSTESMKDNWTNNIGAMKDSWKAFLFQVNNGNFQGLKDLISYAKQARWALDSLGDASALFNLDYNSTNASMTELLSNIQRKKKAGQDYSSDLASYNKLLDNLRKDAAFSNQTANKALEALFGKHGIVLGDYGLTPMEAARQARLAAAGYYPDVERLRRAKNTTPDINDISDFDPTTGESATKKLLKEWGAARYNTAELLSTLGNITTEEKEGIEKILNEISQRERTISSMEKQINRYLTAEDLGGTSGKGGGSKSSRAAVSLIPGLSPISPVTDDTLQRMDALGKKLAYTYDLERMNAEMALEWQMRIAEINSYADAINGLAGAFSAIGNAMGDTPFGAFMSTMGTVAQQIGGLINTYSQLVAVEAVQESLKAGTGIPFPFNIAMIAAAVTSIMSIISSAKSNFAGSFANGGIVGGTSYTGDRLFARVNSGEMIIPKKDWSSGLGFSGNVHFIIEGSQLKGVLDNYDKTISL